MKLGFIGCGNMAGAIMGGIIKKGIFKPEEIIGADVFAPTREKAQATYGINITESNLEVVEKSEVIVLAVKPQFYEAVITEIKDKVTDEKIVITIAPGKTLAWLEEKFGKAVKIVRTMPNTPAMVMEGMTAASPNKYLSEEEVKYAEVHRHMYLCLSKQWQMRLYLTECQDHRHTNLPHRQYSEVQRWYWKQENIREN